MFLTTRCQEALVPDIGDEIQLAAAKVGQASRTGVVTDVQGRMITVQWPSGETSRLFPAAGTLTVVRPAGRVARGPKAGVSPSRGAKTNAAPSASTKKATPAKDRAAKEAAANAATTATAKKAPQGSPVGKPAKGPISPKRAAAPQKAARKRG